MAACILLRHETADGGHHYDWMIQRGAAGESGGALTTFRVAERIDLGVAEFTAERLADHRAEYLAFEGAVSGGRGHVRRVATGELVVEADDADRYTARGVVGSVRGGFCGRRVAGASWQFEFRPEKPELQG